MKKAAIQLSMNFLVILIVSLVILGVGTAIFYKLKIGADDYIREVDEMHQRQLDKYLVGGTRIAVADASKDVKKNKFTTFFMGIKNDLEEGMNFSVEVTYNGVTTADNPDTLQNKQVRRWIKNPLQILEINNNQRFYTTIGVRPDEGDFGKGQYVFNVDVCYGDSKNTAKCTPGDTDYSNRYPPPLQIFVNVI